MQLAVTVHIVRAWTFLWALDHDILQTHEATAARMLQLKEKQSAIGELLAEADSNFAEDPTFAIHIFCDFWMSLVF